MKTKQTYPALKGLSELSELRPAIVIDTREQRPLRFKTLQAVKGTLQTGDYSGLGIEHLFTVEKKTIVELPQIFTSDRDRFSRECERLRGYRFKRLLIIGSPADISAGNYRSNVSPKAILHSLNAFECRYDLPVVFAPGPEDAARLVERWVYWFSRELVASCNSLLRAQKKLDVQSHSPA